MPPLNTSERISSGDEPLLKILKEIKPEEPENGEIPAKLINFARGVRTSIVLSKKELTADEIIADLDNVPSDKTVALKIIEEVRKVIKPSSK